MNNKEKYVNLSLLLCFSEMFFGAFGILTAGITQNHFLGANIWVQCRFCLKWISFSMNHKFV